MSPFGGWVFGGSRDVDGYWNDLYYLGVKGHVLPSTTATEAGCYSVQTPVTAEGQPYTGNFWPLPAGGHKQVTIKVTASSDAHVAFFGPEKIGTQAYEIVIGGWGDTQSAIRPCEDCDGVYAQTPNVNGEPDEEKEFWADCLVGRIRWGTGHTIGVNVLQEWQAPSPFDCDYVDVKTGWGSSGDWEVCLQGHVLPSTTATEAWNTTFTSTVSTSITSTVSTITTSRPKWQVVEKIPVEIGPAASVQQQEAAAAVQMEDKRQQDAVASVLQELDLEKLEEVGGFTVDEEGSVTVAAISPRANASSFRFRAASSGQDFTPDVEIPVSLVANVSTEPLMLAVNVMNQGGAEKLQMADEQPPSTRPLVLSMFNAEGMPLVAASLPEPVLLTLAPDASDDTTCVFWNETLQRWSAEGVTRVQGRGRELVCETTHLSIFAGIEGFLTEVALTFQCSNTLLLFSREAAASLGKKGDWAMQVPSVIFFSILALLLSGVVFALCLDYRSWQRHCATHELQDELHRGVTKKKTYSASVGVVFIYEEVAWKQLLLLNPIHWSLFLDPDNLLLPRLSGTIEKAQAANLSITTKSMDAVIGLAAQTGSPRKSDAGDKSAPGDFHKSKTVAEEVRRGRDLVKLHNQAADKFMAPGCKGFLYRWAMLSAAFHPWCLLISFCFRISHAARALLRASHLLASAAVSVVFYQLTDAVKKECEKTSAADPRWWVRKLVVGIVGEILSSGLMVVLLLIRKSGSKSGESRLRLRLALLQLIVFWLGLALYMFLCVYAVLAFLANMSDKDTSDWVETWLISLLFTLALKPVLRGLFVATVFSCALRFWPGLADKVKDKRRLPQLQLDPVAPVAVGKAVDRFHNVQDMPSEGQLKEGRTCQLEILEHGLAPTAPKQEVLVGCCWSANFEAEPARKASQNEVRASFESDKDDSNFAEVLEPDFQDGRGEAVYCGNLVCSPPRRKVGEA